MKSIAVRPSLPFYETTDNDFYQRKTKRLIDISLVILSAPVVVAVIVLLSVLSSLDGAMPFYKQDRVGRYGRVFKCWKLRSMRPNADRILGEILMNDHRAKAEWDLNNKLVNDPRITPFGSFLRKTSLDELPQLWNVLRGDMSLVGPRPIVQDELEKYGADAAHYLSLRPGLTGLWQTSGRNSIGYDARIALDVSYTKSVSLWLDLWIIARTFKTVWSRTGM